MGKPIVLFLCTGNSARSQMAEALLREYAGDHFEVHSAGTDPKGVNPLTVRGMEEIGIDMAGHRSKHAKEYLGRLPVCYLITVCAEAERVCPTCWPGVVVRMFWPFEDPAACAGDEEERLEKFREVRDQIADRIRGWLSEVVAATRR
jgi:arsenate reductase (thioredoxin)